MKLHNIKPLREAEDHPEIAAWMQRFKITQYVVNPDNSVTINQDAVFHLDGKQPTPFSYIAAINGDANITPLNGAAQKIQKRVKAVNGDLEYNVQDTQPILGLVLIKGIRNLILNIWEDVSEDESEEYDLPPEILQHIQDAMHGVIDIHQLQEILFDAGFTKMARI